MTPEEKEDLQFWFYSGVFVDKKNPEQALDTAARNSGVEREEARTYLVKDQRLRAGSGGWELVPHDRDAADPRGVYVDIEWMTQILRHQAQLAGPELHQALSYIFKIPPDLARAEAEAIPDTKGDDE